METEERVSNEGWSGPNTCLDAVVGFNMSIDCMQKLDMSNEGWVHGGRLGKRGCFWGRETTFTEDESKVIPINCI